MYLLGYSIDNLSLMALTLCVGFVVDDAIVVLENIVRHMEMGKPRMQAALDGAGEVGPTIVTMTTSLSAVFIPIMFMGGLVGMLFHEFGVTIAVAILVSGCVSLSLTPMLCSRFLTPIHGADHGTFYTVTESIYQAGLRAYERSLDWIMDHRPVMLALSAVTLVRHGDSLQGDPQGALPERRHRLAPGDDRGRRRHLVRSHPPAPNAHQRHPAQGSQYPDDHAVDRAPGVGQSGARVDRPQAVGEQGRTTGI